MTGSYSPVELSSVHAAIGRQLAGLHDDRALPALTSIAVRRVPGAEFAGVTIGHVDVGFVTVAATDELVERTDAIQYELGSGPCVDAVLVSTTFNAADLRTDHRWPQFGARAFAASGVISMLSLRLFLAGDLDTIAALNLYSTHVGAFDAGSETIATLLATHSALVLGRISASISAPIGDQVHNLTVALQTNRKIGTATGIIMATAHVTADHAFALLQIQSQYLARPVSELAAEIARTGRLLDLPGAR